MASNNNTPTHRVFQVRDNGEGRKASWTQIGVGFTNRDGSINLLLNAVPLDGKLQLRAREHSDQSPKGSSSTASPADTKDS